MKTVAFSAPAEEQDSDDLRTAEAPMPRLFNFAAVADSGGQARANRGDIRWDPQQKLMLP